MTELDTALRIRSADDQAHLELFGSGQAAFVDPTSGVVVANPEHPYLGVVNQARLEAEDEARQLAALQSEPAAAHARQLAARRARRQVNMRVAEAQAYVDEVLSVQEAEDLPLSQAKLLTDIRRGEEAHVLDRDPLEIIRQFGVLTLAEYRQKLNYPASEQVQAPCLDGLSADIHSAVLGAGEHPTTLAKHRREEEGQLEATESVEAEPTDEEQRFKDWFEDEDDTAEPKPLPYERPVRRDYDQHYGTAQKARRRARIRDWYAQQDTFNKVFGWTIGVVLTISGATDVYLYFHPAKSGDTGEVMKYVALHAQAGERPQAAMTRFLHNQRHIPMPAARAYADQEVSMAATLLSTNKKGTKTLVLDSSGKFQTSEKFYAPPYMLDPSRQWVHDYQDSNQLP